MRSADTLVELKAKLNGWTALISDFGLALEISEEEARNENIKRSSMAGTVVFSNVGEYFKTLHSNTKQVPF